MAEDSDVKAAGHSGLVFQGLIGIAVWMSFGLLLEGLIAFRIPDYLSDVITREMFRLAHAHGTLLSLVLVVVGLAWKSEFISVAPFVNWMLRIGSVAMPVGFMLGGIGNSTNDPSPLVFIAPTGGVMMIFGIVAAAVSFRRG